MGLSPASSHGGTVRSALAVVTGNPVIAGAGQITFTAAPLDEGGFFDLANGEFLIPAKADGVYLIGFGCGLVNSAAASVYATLYAEYNGGGGGGPLGQDGVYNFSLLEVSADAWSGAASACLPLYAGDRVRAKLTAAGGGNITVPAAENTLWLSRVA